MMSAAMRRFLTALLVFVAARAAAADLPCGAAERGTVQLDGIVDDWNDVAGIDLGGQDPNLSATVKCNVEPNTLLLLVAVRDSYFVRTPKAVPGEDHFELKLGGRRLMVFPGDAAKIKDKVAWAGSNKPAKGV